MSIAHTPYPDPTSPVIVRPVLEHWVRDVRPALRSDRHPALWVTERRGRVSGRSINTAFCAAQAAAGLDPALDLHCLRHSYVTHLIEFGYPVKFVQDHGVRADG